MTLTPVSSTFGLVTRISSHPPAPPRRPPPGPPARSPRRCRPAAAAISLLPPSRRRPRLTRSLALVVVPAVASAAVLSPLPALAVPVGGRFSASGVWRSPSASLLDTRVVGAAGHAGRCIRGRRLAAAARQAVV